MNDGHTQLLLPFVPAQLSGATWNTQLVLEFGFIFREITARIFQSKFKCAYLHHLGILKFQAQVHFHIIHYPPLDLVLTVNFGNRWNEMMFQEHLLILLSSGIPTNSDNLHSNETSGPSSTLRYSFATPY